MKLKKIFLLLFLIVFCTSLVCFATTEVNNEVEEIDSTGMDGEPVISNDYFNADSNLTLDAKRIEGNAFLFAEKLNLSNVEITGSLYIAGQNINLEDVNVLGSIFVAGNYVEMDNTRARNIYSFSSNANFKEEIVIEKNIYAYSDSIKLNAVVDGDVGISGNNITFGDDLSIVGNLSVTSEDEPNVPETASIGNYEFNKIESSEDNKSSFNMSDYLLSIVKYLVIVIILALILNYILPGFIEKVKNYELNDMIKALGIGVVSSILIPILAFVLAISIIGFRFFVAVSLLYVIGLMFATPIACNSIGILVSKKTGKTEKKYIIGYTLLVALIYAIIKQIPVMSIIIEIILGFLGFGVIVKSLIPAKK